MAFEMGNVAAGVNTLMTVLGVLLIVVAIGLGFWYYWRMLQYKIPITVHKVIDDASGVAVEYTDKARRLTKRDGENELHLKKLKLFVNNPPADFYTKTMRGEKLYFRWDGGKVLVPQKVVYNSPLTFKPATYNILSQMAWRIKTRAERHKNKSFWDLYGGIIVWMGVVVLSAITLWILFTKLELVAGSINNLASAVQSVNAAQVVQ